MRTAAAQPRLHVAFVGGLKLVQVPGAGLKRLDRAARSIAGAALEVWYSYPTTAGPTRPAHQPFHALPNVLMTPHVSGWTQGMLEARAQHIAANIHRAGRGEPPVQQIPVAGA